MKTYISIIIFGIVCMSAFSAKAVSSGEVIGQVIEKETSKPVAFAQIVFENSMDKVVVTANEYGYYYAMHLPTGKYQMRVTYNNRTFVVNKVRVYDSYSTEMNFVVSNSNNLPETVEVIKKEPVINPLQPNDIILTSNTLGRGSASLGDVLMMQPGLDVVDGKLYVKGSDKVRFFIDGTPVMGIASIR